MRKDTRVGAWAARIGVAGLVAGSLLLPVGGVLAAPRHVAGGSQRVTAPFRPVELFNQGRNATSGNWAGYVAGVDLKHGTSRTVSDVTGEWNIPKVQCGSSGIVGAWVGLDGFTNQTVEQTGTAMGCQGSSAYYYL